MLKSVRKLIQGLRIDWFWLGTPHRKFLRRASGASWIFWLPGFFIGNIWSILRKNIFGCRGLKHSQNIEIFAKERYSPSIHFAPYEKATFLDDLALLVSEIVVITELYSLASLFEVYSWSFINRMQACCLAMSWWNWFERDGFWTKCKFTCSANPWPRLKDRFAVIPAIFLPNEKAGNGRFLQNTTCFGDLLQSLGGKSGHKTVIFSQ